MQIKILTVGKIKEGPISNIIKDYLKRTPEKIKIIEIEVKKKLDPISLKEEESKLIIKELSNNSYSIALDERGDNISSEEFSKIIYNQKTIGIKELFFIIGGAYGLSPSIRKRANITISFGKLVWPHKMARMMLIEQIYRSSMINKNHPYHK